MLLTQYIKILDLVNQKKFMRYVLIMNYVLCV